MLIILDINFLKNCVRLKEADLFYYKQAYLNLANLFEVLKVWGLGIKRNVIREMDIVFVQTVFYIRLEV